MLSDGDATGDLAGVDLVDVEDADVIVIGGACDDFTYATMNRIFRRLMDGASLVGMHRNLFWKTSEGWELDGGAYIAGLEEAADTKATICGKPEKAYFDAALAMLGVEADRAAMVGDDIVNDILGAQAAGLTGILVRTGKYREGDEDQRATGGPITSLDVVRGRPRVPRVGVGGSTAMARRSAPASRGGSSRASRPQYERMGALLSFGQDGRWRRFLVSEDERGSGIVGPRRRGRDAARLP